MSFKKNAVSYGIWALYLMGIGVVLSFMGMVVGNQDTGVPYMALLLVALAFGSLFLVYFLAKRLVDSVQIKEIASGRAALIEGALVAALLAVGTALRLAMIGGAGEEAAYYEVAKVTEEGMQVQLVQGSIYYYLCLLNGLFRVVGNKWIAGIYLQLVLQMLGIVIAYFAVRRLSGRGPALVSLLFLVLAPGSIRAGVTYSPKMLYFCVYALILLSIAQYLWRSTRPGGRWLTWFLALFCGALAGFAGYTDAVGFTLAVPLCGLPALKREQKSMLQWVAQLLLSMLAMAGTFCLLVQLDSVMSGSTFGRVLQAWEITYKLKESDYSFFFQEGGYETLLLLALMALGIFTFMRRKNEERFSPWVVMVLSVTLMRMLGILTPNMNGSYQMFFAMTGLAGVAFCELFVQGGGETEGTGVPEAVVEDLDQEMPEPMAAGQEEGLSAGVWPPERPMEGRPAQAVREISPGPSDNQGRPAKTDRRPSWRRQRYYEQGGSSPQAVPKVEEREEMAEKKREEPRQVQYIENPLPLPKKHVKKVMDFPIQPEASQMHYDLEVDPGDNFDF